MTTPHPFTVLRMLRKFAEQRPGLDPRNYGDAASYRADAKRITRQLNDARELLALAETTPYTIEPHLIDALSRGRLTLAPTADGTDWRLDFTTCQYWPTEYRAAVCRVLATAIWSMMRDRYPDRHPRDSVRQLVFRGVANRWFR